MMFMYIDFAKVLACLLIINFHTLYVYPESLKFMSFGGDLGNNIFFLVSGFLLYDKTRRTNWRDSASWLGKRYWRVFPAVFLVEILTVIIMKTSIESVSQFIRMFVFPSQYWFTGALLLFFPLYFLMVKVTCFRERVIIAAILLFLHVVFDSLSAERYIVGFLALMTGAELKDRLNANSMWKVSTTKLWLGLIIALSVYGALKILYGRNSITLYHVLIGIITIVATIYLILLLRAHEDRFNVCFVKHTYLKALIGYLSKMTLFFYLTQQLINKCFLSILLPFVFGVRIGLYWGLTAAGAILLYLIDLLIHGQKPFLRNAR